MTEEARKELNRYFHRIEGLMDGTKEQKTEFLSRLKQEITAFQRQNPDASVKEICKQFGSPEQVAGEYAEEYGFMIGKPINFKKVIPIFAAVTLLLFLLFVILAKNNAKLKSVNPLSEQLTTTQTFETSTEPL